LVLALFCALIYAIVGIGWHWWSQSVAAIAIHDGARDAAARHGDLPTGYATTRRILAASLGQPNAQRWEGHFWLQLDGSRRSVYGWVDLPHATRIPFLGEHSFWIRASTLQRDWQFYGGPPHGWE
jgi:hypothetical protein